MPDVAVTVGQHLMQIRLDRPEKRNARTAAMCGAMADALAAADADPAVRCRRSVECRDGPKLRDRQPGRAARPAGAGGAGDRPYCRRAPPEAVRQTKHLVQRGLGAVAAQIAEEGTIFSERLRSPEAREAMTAFLEKRAPRFK